MSPPPMFSRRTLTLGAAAAGIAALAAGAVYEVTRLVGTRVRGPYAALVNLLDDPTQAAILGQALDSDVLDGPAGKPARLRRAAEDLRSRLAGHRLSELLQSDLGSLSSMVEADGWVIPFTLAELCALAAESV